MKKVLLILCLSSFVIACHDSRDNVIKKIPKKFDKTVGEQIPLDVANRWIENFSEHAVAGRQKSIYSISATTITQLLSLSDGPGVVLHHATDENSVHHILMSTVNGEGGLLETDIVDLSSGLVLSSATAKAWAQTYANEHPATPWYHFFGGDIFSEIQSNPAFEYVDVVRAENDENEEQLLLFVYNTKGVSGGRSEGQDVTVYDLSTPCPPCAN